ncbi:MAG TPA: ECF transporter S component [Firmicutes bacterium]|nr:ECF transporter S component [Bacillota bacterium]
MKTTVRIAFLGAMGGLLMLYETPILMSATFLKWDPGDIPALIGGFAMGPGAGVLIQLLKALIFQLSGKNSTGIVGLAALLLAGITFTLSASLVYRYLHTRAGAILSLIAGSVAMTAVMVFANWLVFLPLWGIPAEQIPGLVLSAVLPFNLLKGAISSVITFALYKKTCVLLGLRPASEVTRREQTEEGTGHVRV